MTFNGTVWNSAIPGQKRGKSVEYYVESYDNAGNQAKSAIDSYLVKSKTNKVLPYNIPIGVGIIVSLTLVAFFILKKRK